MKIVQIMSGARYGGAENFFMRLVSSLAIADIDQCAIIRTHQQRKDTLVNRGIMVSELPFRGTFDFYTRYKLKKYVNEFMPDIVMSWMNRASNMAPAGKWQNVGRLGGYYNLKYYKKCHHLICNTKDICDYVIKQGRPAKNVWYIPNFVEEKQQEAIKREEFNTPDDVPLILAMGRLHKNKAFDTLIHAMNNVPGAYLWIAGEGPEANKLKAIINRNGLENRVRFLGWREDIAALHATADIFVCSSRHEPLGNIILEAWAHKTPVVSTKSQGPSQLINDKTNGILVETDTPDELAGGIKLLLENRELSGEIMENGYQTYIKNFSRDVIVKKYIEFFQQVI